MSSDQYDQLWLLGFCASLIIAFGLGAIKGGNDDRHAICYLVPNHCLRPRMGVWLNNSVFQKITRGIYIMKMNDKKTKLLVGAVVVAASISTANAALPDAAQAAFDSVTASVVDISTAAYALLGAVLVPGIIIKLVKKFTSKAS